MPESYRENKRGEKNGRAKPMRCIETGRIYPTFYELAKELGFSKAYISKRMKTNKEIGGFHYELINKEEKENGNSASES